MLEVESDDYRKIVDVKIEDLLNRGVIELDNDGLNQLIRGKSVIVTGAGVQSVRNYAIKSWV